jgi:8-oxo-dGTP pyrophosphatase MutT (NUDIX family)
MSLDSLKARLIDGLHSPDSWRPDADAGHSDFDLNPGAAPDGTPLRPAAVLVPVIAHADGATVLLTRRAETLTSHTGQIAFPGGRRDPGETAVQTALREAREEVGLDPAAVEVLGIMPAYRTGTGFLITPVVGWIAAAPALTAQANEVADMFEVPWDFLMNVANHRRDHLDPTTGPRRWFWAMPFEDRYIWGVTAGMIRALHDRLYSVEPDPEAAAAEDAS